MKIFEKKFAPSHVYFCSFFSLEALPIAVSHLYHAPYKALIFSRVSKTLQFALQVLHLLSFLYKSQHTFSTTSLGLKCVSV